MAQNNLERFVPPDVREEVIDVGDILLRWAGRSLGRAAFVEPARESLRYSNAKGKNVLSKDFNVVAAEAGNVLFPMTTGVRQSRWGEIPFIGGVLQLGAFGMDAAASVGGITIPFLGWFGRVGYHFLAAGVTEALPDRKIVSNARHPRGRRG